MVRKFFTFAFEEWRNFCWLQQNDIAVHSGLELLRVLSHILASSLSFCVLPHSACEWFTCCFCFNLSACSVIFAMTCLDSKIDSESPPAATIAFRSASKPALAAVIRRTLRGNKERKEKLHKRKQQWEWRERTEREREAARIEINQLLPHLPDQFVATIFSLVWLILPFSFPFLECPSWRQTNKHRPFFIFCFDFGESSFNGMLKFGHGISAALRLTTLDLCKEMMSGRTMRRRTLTWEKKEKGAQRKKMKKEKYIHELPFCQFFCILFVNAAWNRQDIRDKETNHNNNAQVSLSQTHWPDGFVCLSSWSSTSSSSSPLWPSTSASDAAACCCSCWSCCCCFCCRCSACCLMRASVRAICLAASFRFSATTACNNPETHREGESRRQERQACRGAETDRKKKGKKRQGNQTNTTGRKKRKCEERWREKSEKVDRNENEKNSPKLER